MISNWNTSKCFKLNIIINGSKYCHQDITLSECNFTHKLAWRLGGMWLGRPLVSRKVISFGPYYQTSSWYRHLSTNMLISKFQLYFKELDLSNLFNVVHFHVYFIIYKLTILYWLCYNIFFTKVLFYFMISLVYLLPSLLNHVRAPIIINLFFIRSRRH